MGMMQLCLTLLAFWLSLIHSMLSAESDLSGMLHASKDWPVKTSLPVIVRHHTTLSDLTTERRFSNNAHLPLR